MDKRQIRDPYSLKVNSARERELLRVKTPRLLAHRTLKELHTFVQPAPFALCAKIHVHAPIEHYLNT